MSVLLIALGILLFVGLVLAHEYGHFKLARKNGVGVEEFGLGFPPKLWGKKLKSGMLLSINLLPLGGFVRLKGEYDADKNKGSFGAAPLKAKIKIMLAGVAVNLVLAVGLLTVVALLGMPQILDDQFNVASDAKVVRQDVILSYVEPGSPAAKAKLKEGDIIKRIYSGLTCGLCDFSIDDKTKLPEATQFYEGEEVSIDIIRDGEPRTVKAGLLTESEVVESRQTNDPKGYLGVVPENYTLKRSTWSAPLVAVGVTAQATKSTFVGLGSALSSLFAGDTTRASEQVSGPVGIFFLMKQGSILGLEFLLLIVGLISLTLAIMNSLPIPALDGGRLFVTLLYRLLKKPLTPKAEEFIHGTGLTILLLLFVLITIVDVKKFF